MNRAEHESPDVFVTDAKGGAGLTRAQTRGRGFASPCRGVRVRRELVDDPTVRQAAAMAACRVDAVLTDVAAARTWNLPLPPWLGLEPIPVSVLVSADAARPKRAGVRGRRLELPDEHVVVKDGFRVTTAARTWLDCCAEVPLAHAVAMGDAVLHRRLATAAELAEIVRWGVRRRGIVSARRALRYLDPGAESPGESLARMALVTGGIRRPRCNADIFDDGQWLARADMLWDDERVIAEYDGAVHISEWQRRIDAARRDLLQEAGWIVIVFTARDLKHPEAMCAMVRSALLGRSWSPALTRTRTI